METIELDGPGGGWRVLVPRNTRERMRGLRGHPPQGPRDALLLPRCRSIHTFGMGAPIRVVLLDAELTVVAVRIVRPRRVLLPRPRTRHVLECGAGPPIRIGDRFSRRVEADRR